MTHTLRLDVTEGTIHDTHVAKHPRYHGSDVARGHEPGADALCWGMRQRWDGRPPQSILVDTVTVWHDPPALGALPVADRPRTGSRWHHWRGQWWCDGWRHWSVGCGDFWCW